MSLTMGTLALLLSRGPQEKLIFSVLFAMSSWHISATMVGKQYVKLGVASPRSLLSFGHAEHT